ncbi:MAG: DUF642 domain-containing protein, partial [Candidatus Electrothrix sp. AR4]|nr:DUF642 domain-containing protein [Candidatus Electrothrix sp. AR4]
MKKDFLKIAVFLLGFGLSAAPICNATLIQNGDFEVPEVRPGGWGAFVDTSVPGWTVEHSFPTGNKHVSQLEIWNQLMSAPYSGDQHIELDGYDSTKISQDVQTEAGRYYVLTYTWAPRPGVSDNQMNVLINDEEIAAHSASGQGHGTISWTTESYVFEAADTLTNIAFSEVGTDNGLGMLLDDVNLREYEFDIVTMSGYGTDNTAEGTSNGVGWSICSTHFSSCCGANTTGTYNGFNSGSFDPPIANQDDLHVTQDDFSLVFDQPINSIVFYLRENGGNASLDFGLVPEVVSGAANLTIVGTRIRPNTQGGAVRFSNVNSNILSHAADICDGMNLAFYVESLAPGGYRDGVCPQQDTDNDGIGDTTDNCPNTPNAAQSDEDDDGIGDACDACPLDSENDADSDGVCGDEDICPGHDDNVDADGDIVSDGCDNCPADANEDQTNRDGDALGDACDVCPLDSENDADGDEICGDLDNC